MEIEKLKVAELRSELASRGLDSKGTKPILVARLREAIQSEESSSSKPGVESSASAASSAVKPEGSQETSSSEQAPLEEKESNVEQDTPDEDEEMKEEDSHEKSESVPANGADNNNAQEEDPHQPEEEEEEEEDEEDDEEEETPKEAPCEGENGDKKEVTPKSNRQQRRGVKRKLNEDEPFVISEDEPEMPEDVCLLDWYNSDLHLLIDKESFQKADPLFKDGWGYVWAGAKGTHGVKEGKMAFQVKLTENLDSKLEEEKDLHELRLGFSTEEPSMQLGESKHSFSYGGSGKKGTNSTFEEYGETFSKGDIMGAYVDMTSEEVKITFTKNDVTLDEAFSFPKSELEGKALFPHISTRNIQFEVNFGKTKDGTAVEAWTPLLPGYEFPSNLPSSVRGPSRIPTREECEMIMMIGLPASGKTTWVNKYVDEHPDKRYYVIGTTSLIDKMKINGVSRRTSHTGRRDVLIQKCTRCLQDWLRLASQRRRNIIIDQTNVYPNAQKRKVRPFEGMIRKAVVVVPSDEEYKARAEAQEKAENKDVPDSAVMEMKANFSLPLEGGLSVTTKNAEGEEETKETVSPFKEIIFAHLNREEAQALVDEYNKDAKEKGYGKKMESKAKRARGNNFRRGRAMIRGRRGGFVARGFRGLSNGRRFMRGMHHHPHHHHPHHQRRGGAPPPMRGFMPPRGMQFNRGGGGGNRNQVKFGKNVGRPNWGQEHPAPWSQWQQPNRPTGWGHWNQGGGGNQGHAAWGGGGHGNSSNNSGNNNSNRGHHNQSFHHHHQQQQGFASGSNLGGGGGGHHWNSSSNSSGWGGNHSNPASSSGWNHSNNSSGWNNGPSNSGWNTGGGGHKWSSSASSHNNSNNQGYPGNSYWGGGGGGNYGGR